MQKNSKVILRFMRNLERYLIQYWNESWFISWFWYLLQTLTIQLRYCCEERCIDKIKNWVPSKLTLKRGSNRKCITNIYFYKWAFTRLTHTVKAGLSKSSYLPSLQADNLLIPGGWWPSVGVLGSMGYGLHVGRLKMLDLMLVKEIATTTW